MATRKAMPQPTEPIGIIISNGDREEPQPFFWSYVWGPVPDESTETPKKRVA